MVETGFMTKKYSYLLSKTIRKDGTILAKHIIEHKCGLMDENNCIYLDCIYDAISLFSNNYAEVVKDGKIGLVNIGGYIVLDCIYNAISEFDENNLAMVSYNGMEGLFSSLGTWLIEPTCPIIYPAFHDKYVVCKNEEFTGTNEGKVYKRDSLSYRRGDYYRIKEDNRFNIRNRKQYPPKGKYGIIDSSGNIIVDYQYDFIYPFDDGQAVVVNGSQMGVIDEFGYVIIPVIYEKIEEFHEGLALVVLGGQMGVIDTNGSVIVPAIYDKIEDFYKGFASVKSGDKWGVVNSLGEIIIPIKYEKVICCVPSQIIMQNGNDIYNFNSKGELIVQSKEYVIPRLDLGNCESSWADCFKKADLIFADDYSFYNAMELWNK